MPTLAPTRTGVLIGILAAAYRVVPASRVLSAERGSYRRSDYARAYDTAVASIEEAGLSRDSMPVYAAAALDELRHTARGTSPHALPARSQQIRASLAVADAVTRLIAEEN